MPTKEQIKRINSRRIISKGFSEKELRDAGSQAISDVVNNKLKAYYNISEVYAGFGGSYNWSVVTSSVDSRMVADFFRNNSLEAEPVAS